MYRYIKWDSLILLKKNGVYGSPTPTYLTAWLSCNNAPSVDVAQNIWRTWGSKTWGNAWNSTPSYQWNYRPSVNAALIINIPATSCVIRQNILLYLSPSTPASVSSLNRFLTALHMCRCIRTCFILCSLLTASCSFSTMSSSPPTTSFSRVASASSRFDLAPRTCEVALFLLGFLLGCLTSLEDESCTRFWALRSMFDWLYWLKLNQNIENDHHVKCCIQASWAEMLKRLGPFSCFIIWSRLTIKKNSLLTQNYYNQVSVVNSFTCFREKDIYSQFM